MDLDIFAGLPAYACTIAGRDWKFTEIDLAGLAELQAWLRANVPHPLDAVRGHLAGLAPEDRAALLDSARRESLDWPPKVGSPEAAYALLQSVDSQCLILRLALKAHHPELTDVHAGRLFKALRKENGAWDLAEARRCQALRARKDDPADDFDGEVSPRDFPKAQRVIATAFGMPYDDDQAEDDAPKSAGPGPEATPAPSTT